VIILNSLLPIVTLLVSGAIIRKWKLTDAAFIATADRLIYYFFFPVMLFWNIGGAPFGQGITLNFCLAVVCPLLAIYCISGLLIRWLPISDFQACAFAQSCYRFNTYIGMAVILSSLGGEAVRYFGVLISFTIPLLNIFAVSTCIWYSGKEIDVGRRLLVVCRSLAVNPLILSCLAGFLYSWLFGSFPKFIHNSLSLVASVSLPLALLSIGGGLNFKGIGNDLPLSF
jgi:predicted permease